MAPTSIKPTLLAASMLFVAACTEEAPDATAEPAPSSPPEQAVQIQTSLPEARPTEDTSKPQPYLKPHYRLVSRPDSGLTEAPSPQRDWTAQTEDALKMSQHLQGMRGHPAVEFASKAYRENFAHWIPVTLPLEDKIRNIERDDLYLPNLLSAYHLEDELEEQLAEDSLGIFKFKALQLPMIAPFELLLAPQSSAARPSQPAVEELLKAGPVCKGDRDDRLRTYVYASPDPVKDRAAYLLLVSGCVIGMEGGGLHPATATQLLVYDSRRHLTLVAGFGQVTLLTWSRGQIDSAIIANGFGVPGSMLKTE